MSKEFTNQQKIDECWRRGIIIPLKCHPAQKLIHAAVTESKAKLFVINSARRLGKSFYLCCYALEYAIQNPGAQIKFAAPNQKMVRKIITPLMKQILVNCPKPLRPRFKSLDGVYEFPNGSEISVAGTEMGQIDNLRGTAMDLGIIDEAGFATDLEYVIGSVLMPQTLTRPNARIILASTPPVSPDHAFVTYAQRAMDQGAYARFTIYDNPLITTDRIEEYKTESGGGESTTWKREYLCIEGSSLVMIRTPDGTVKILTIKELKYELLPSKEAVTLKAQNAPSLNGKGYEVLTPGGFQSFTGVSYNGIVPCLTFRLNNHLEITVSEKHRFTSNKIAKDYLVGEALDTLLGVAEIIEINPAGKKQVFDLLDVNNGHLYYANDIVNHNCEFVTDRDSAIFPEASEETMAEIVQDLERPRFFLPFTAVDLGFLDYTGALLGYYDFANGKVVIEDEVLVNKSNSSELVQLIRDREKDRWGNIEPRTRVVDGNSLQIADLNSIHKFSCVAPAKYDLVANVNRIRIDLQDRRIVIHPRCKNLITQVMFATWDASRSKFSRSHSGGHWDLVAALIYLGKHIDRRTNPVPPGHGWDYHNSFGVNRKNTSGFASAIQNLFPTRK